jgi:hypothetical protein
MSGGCAWTLRPVASTKLTINVLIGLLRVRLKPDATYGRCADAFLPAYYAA